MRRFSRYADAAFLALFTLLGAIPSVIVFKHRNYTFFYQNFTPESVMWACGYGMRHPQAISDDLAAFLLGKVQSFDCATIDPNGEFGPMAVFASVQPWITWLAALLWRLFGVHQTALLPLVAVLAGLYAGGCYALSRLFLGRLLAVVAAAVLCVSPVATEMALFLRDNSKGPFFIWAIVFLILALRPGLHRSSLVFAGLAGTVVGTGYGFRADLAIIAPIGAAVLAIAAIAGVKAYPFRIFAPLLFLAAAGLSALPAHGLTNIVAGGGSVAIQGASERFRDDAGIEPAGYALGWAYSDELTLSEVASVERPKTPDWDIHEGQRYYGFSQAMQRATSYLLGWAPLFAADFATQALKSAGWALSFPSLFARSDMPWAHFQAAYLLPMYGFLAKPWIILVTLAGFIALLWRAYLRSPSEAICIFLLLAFLMGYPGIQFAMRHIFHLEFVWVISVLSLISVSLRPSFSAKPARGFAVTIVVIAIVMAISYFGLIEWQRTVLSRQVAGLLAVPREVLETQPSIRSDGSVFYGLQVPARHAAIIASPSDSLTPAIRLVGIPWDVRAEADRLVLTVTGDRCPTGPLAVRLAYDKTENAWQPMDADLSLDVAGGSASAFFPAFYRPTQHFAGIVLPASHRDCSVTLERIVKASVLPLAMSGRFSGGMLAGPLNKAFGGFTTTSHTPSFIEAAPK